ncbi:MAG: EMC3/TMCO1 family protein [Candidatus Woesearchaeota archaeon]
MSFFNPIMAPFLNMNPLLAIFIISLTLSVMITIIYKLMTDQELMKTLKQDLKSIQKEVKALKDHPEKMMKKQQEAMEKNMKYMMHSLKPTLITFIPILLVFGWLNANFAYEPIVPGQEFDVTVTLNRDVYGNIMLVPPSANNSIEYLEQDLTKQITSREMSFRFRAVEKGIWDFSFILNNETEYPVSVKVDDKEYIGPEYSRFEDRNIRKIHVGNEKKVVLNLFGWEMGWLAAYIILSIIFSISLRKILKLH